MTAALIEKRGSPDRSTWGPFGVSSDTPLHEVAYTELSTEAASAETDQTRLGRPILVVDDDPDTTANLQDILEQDGYRADVAGSIADALVLASAQSYGAYLVDRGLPDGDGQTLLNSLRREDPEAAVVIMTGYGDLDSAIAAVRQGAMDYILKPINADALRNSLQRIAERQGLEARLRQSERLAAIGTVVSAVSHEVRNEFHALHLAVELLKFGSDEGDSESSRAIARLQKGHQRLQRQFEDIRNFAAPVHLECVECSIDEIWSRAWIALSPAFQNRDVELDEVIEARDLTCRLDDLRLEQVFRNVFENALAACSDPVRIHVRCREAVLHDRDAVEVVVRDNGPGLNAEQKQKIFDAFFTTKSKGTGLGMAIVKRIIDAHRGSITVADADPRGAEFVISLPRQVHASPQYS